MRVISKALLAVVFATGVATSHAAVVSLDFEHINATYPSGYANILEFYNGGLSSDGTTGTNYGISFGSNALAICLNSLTVSCSNTSRGGLGSPTSQEGALFFLSGSETFLNIAAGFDTGFSFNYVSLNFSGSVSVYDGLNGTGTLLATLNLSPNAGSCPGYNAGFCPFSPIGVLFAGTAHSISFAGVANQIVFDDVTFGSANPGPPAPEPGTISLLALGLLGLAARRRGKSA
jgi:PEP-CTERM motif-containing protein